MQLPNHRPEKLDTLSQHAIETNHRSGKLDMLSQYAQHRQAIPAYTAKSKLYKRPVKAQNSGQADTAKQLYNCKTCTRRATSYNTLGG